MFGGILTGYSFCLNEGTSRLNFETYSIKCSFDQNPEGDDLLRKELQNFWDIETITSPDVICKFENNIEQNGFRYVTKLPFNPDHDFLPYNNNILKVDWLKEKVLNQYNWNFLRLWETVYCWKGFFSFNGQTKYTIWLVISNDKETTKIRAVFDASCSNSGPSLNDCLYSGLNLLENIADILIRFRLNHIGILGDIQQAF